MRHLRLLLLAVSLAPLVPAAAPAAQLLWTFDNDSGLTLELAFYSEDRNHEWPGGGDVWILDPNVGDQSVLLECRNDELICYGVWARDNANRYWGVGSGGRQSCPDCCARCGAGDVEAIQLLP